MLQSEEREILKKYFSESTSRAAKARAAALTPKRRREIAQMGGKARWAKQRAQAQQSSNRRKEATA